MVRAPVDVDEIDHRAGDHAVEQVAGGAADDQGQPQPRRPLMMRQARGVEADADQRRGGDDRDDHRLERKLDAVQEPERGAVVQDVRDVHDPGNHGHAVVLAQVRANHRLGRLIDRDNHHRQPDFEVTARRHGRVALARRHIVERVIH